MITLLVAVIVFASVKLHAQCGHMLFIGCTGQVTGGLMVWSVLLPWAQLEHAPAPRGGQAAVPSGKAPLVFLYYFPVMIGAVGPQLKPGGCFFSYGRSCRPPCKAPACTYCWVLPAAHLLSFRVPCVAAYGDCKRLQGRGRRRCLVCCFARFQSMFCCCPKPLSYVWPRCEAKTEACTDHLRGVTVVAVNLLL